MISKTNYSIPFIVNHAFIHFVDLMISQRWVTVPLFYFLSSQTTSILCIEFTCSSSRMKIFDKRILLTCSVKKPSLFSGFALKRYSCGIFLRTSSKISKRRNGWISFIASDILLLLRFVVLIVFFRISNRSFLCIFCLLIIVFKRFFLLFNGSFLYKVQFSFKEVMEWPHISKYFLGVVL